MKSTAEKVEKIKLGLRFRLMLRTLKGHEQIIYENKGKFQIRVLERKSPSCRYRKVLW